MAVKRQTKKVKRYRFFKSGLPGKIWDPVKNKVLVNFIDSEPKGTFTTTNLEIAKLLRKKGYPEIAVNAKQPPDMAVINPGRSLEEGENVPILNKGASPIAAQNKMEHLTGQPQAPQVITQ